jgi:ATP-dependent Clp protease ATP-binding subunit ClpA
MFERFTDSARKTMAYANQAAQGLNHEYIGTEHILMGLAKNIRQLRPADSVAGKVFLNLNVSAEKMVELVRDKVKPGPEYVTIGKLPQTPRAKKAVEYAIEEARNLNHNYVGDEHLVLGLMREHDGVAASVLRGLNLKLEEVREEILNVTESQQEQAKSPKKRKPRKKRFDVSRAVNAMPIAIAGDHSVISRDEYAELITILGDVFRANGGIGVERVWAQETDLPVDAGVRA